MEKADMYRDEFKRINAIIQCNTDWHNAEEVKGICERAIADIEQAFPVIVQRDKAEAMCAKLQSICEAIIESGRPHTGRNSHFPDGCECEQCEAWDSLKRTINE